MPGWPRPGAAASIRQPVLQPILQPILQLILKPRGWPRPGAHVSVHGVWRVVHAPAHRPVLLRNHIETCTPGAALYDCFMIAVWLLCDCCMIAV